MHLHPPVQSTIHCTLLPLSFGRHPLIDSSGNADLNNVSFWVCYEHRGDHAQVVLISVFVAVLCLCLVIGHLLEENRWLNESTTAIIIVSGQEETVLQNFITIMLFGVIGAWWLFPRFGFTGLSAQDYLAIGTIFSSTDTVCTLQVLHQDETPLLYSLVFGEGVVNDATSVVLFNAVQKLDESKLNGWAALRVLLDFLYLFSTSTALGVVAGLLTAYTLKTLYIGRHSTVREIALMVLMAYLSYMLAEEGCAILNYETKLHS
ncbi:hypothetical protein AAG906_035338 [Vitis piasezkii]